MLTIDNVIWIEEKAIEFVRQTVIIVSIINLTYIYKR